MVCLFSSNIYFRVLFSYYSTPEKRNKWSLNKIYVKIIGFCVVPFLVSKLVIFWRFLECYRLYRRVPIVATLVSSELAAYGSRYYRGGRYLRGTKIRRLQIELAVPATFYLQSICIKESNKNKHSSTVILINQYQHQRTIETKFVYPVSCFNCDMCWLRMSS